MAVYFEFRSFGKFGEAELYLNEEGVTPLHNAVLKNQLHQVQYHINRLKDQNTSLDSQTKTGQTSLLLACKLVVESDIIKALISAGADVNMSDNIKLSPLHAACLNPNPEIAELLLRAGANVNAQDASRGGRPHGTPLHYAVRGMNSKLVDLLLDAGADADLRDCDECIPLLYIPEIFIYFDEATVERLVSVTTDFNCVDLFKDTVFMLAVQDENKKLVSMLIKYGVDVNISAIEYALEKRYTEIFKLLWKSVNIEVFNEIYTNFYYDLINWACSPSPKQAEVFYEVMNTPEVILHPGKRYFNKLALNLTINRLNQSYYYERELFGNNKIDVYEITKKLLEKGAVFRDEDLEGFIYLCTKYYRYKYIDREITLLHLLIDNNVDITPHIIYFSVVNHPEFTLTLLQFCIQCNPIDIFKHFIKIRKRIDVSSLNLIKNVLKLCSPSEELRFQCLLHVQSLSDSREWPERYFDDASGALEVPVFHCSLQSELDYELCEEVLDLLLVDRVPSLLEISRNTIRECLRVCCKGTSAYLQSVKALEIPKMLIDVIQCKENVNML